MSDRNSATPYRLATLADKGALIRLAVIGVAVLIVVECFAFVGGWLSPGRLTQERMIDGFEEVNSVSPGFRRNRAKGVCIAGHFDSNVRVCACQRPPSSGPDRRPSSAVSRSPAASPTCPIVQRRCRRRATRSSSMDRWNSRRSCRMTQRFTPCCGGCTRFWHFCFRDVHCSLRRRADACAESLGAAVDTQ